MPERDRAGATPPAALPVHDIPWSISPAIREAQDAFKRDLPQLLKERPGQWVAYCRDKPIGFAKDSPELWRRCKSLGYQEFIVCCIEPCPESDFITAF
jgi:hypothetical protein